MKGVRFIILIMLISCALIFAQDTENSVNTTDLWIIESIRFQRMFPLFNSDIESSLGFRRGSFVNEEMIREQIPAIKRAMEDRGLRNVKVRIDTEKNLERKSIVITVTKESSERSRVKNIRFEGNSQFSHRQLRRALSAWKYRNGLLDQVEFSSDLKNLQNKYQENTFADAIIIDSIISINEIDAEILLHINEGRKYDVKIPDNGVLRRRLIRKEFDFTARPNLNDRIIRTATRNLENKLLSMGYNNGKVEVSDTTIKRRKKDVRRLSVEIKAGDRISLDSVEFVGNEFFSDKDLLETMRSVITKNGKIHRNGAGSFVPKAIKDDAVILENKYFKNGFLNVEVETQNKVINNSAIVCINIKEGVQTIISSIDFNYTSSTPSQAKGNKVAPDGIVIPLSVNSPLNPFSADTAVQIIRNSLSESGFVNAKVECKIVFNADSSTAQIHFDIDKGQKFVFGDIEFVGNFKTKKRYIERFIDIEKGDDFSNRRLSQNMRNIRKIGVFRSVSNEVVQVEDTNNIRISFDEIYPFIFNFSGGYNTENLFYSQLKLTNRNFLGLNKILSVGGGISAKERFAEANFLEPYFFNEKLSLGIDLYYRNYEIVDKKFWSKAAGNTYSISWRPNSVFSAGINAAYEIRLLYPYNNFDYGSFESNDSIDVSLVNVIRHIISTTPSAIIDFRDSKTRPHKGGFLSSQFLVSHGLTAIQDDYIKAEAEARLFIPMSRLFTLAFRSGIGKAVPYGANTEVAMDGLFKIGGTRTIRGFREGKLWTYGNDFPVLAYSANYNSAELRAGFGAIEIPFFTDFGTITDSDGGNFRKFKYSIGSGIRYITPIGPIGIVYAIPTDAESRSGNSDEHRTGMTGVIHFSIGYSF